MIEHLMISRNCDKCGSYMVTIIVSLRLTLRCTDIDQFIRFILVNFRDVVPKTSQSGNFLFYIT